MSRDGTNRGTISWFDNALGVGFITPEQGGQDVFLMRRLLDPTDESPFEVGEIVELN